MAWVGDVWVMCVEDIADEQERWRQETEADYQAMVNLAVSNSKRDYDEKRRWAKYAGTGFYGTAKCAVCGEPFRYRKAKIGRPPKYDCKGCAWIAKKEADLRWWHRHKNRLGKKSPKVNTEGLVRAPEAPTSPSLHNTGQD